VAVNMISKTTTVHMPIMNRLASAERVLKSIVSETNTLIAAVVGSNERASALATASIGLIPPDVNQNPSTVNTVGPRTKRKSFAQFPKPYPKELNIIAKKRAARRT